MSLPELKELLEAGCHFGHLSSRWNPKMKKYIFMEKNGIHVMDLKKTHKCLEDACKEIERIAANGETILLVGTKKQAQETIRAEAERSNNFYVVERWLGGQLTNFATVKRSVRKWKSLEKKSADGTYEKISKKEILDIERQKEKLSRILGGIANMRRIPYALFVVDTQREHIAISEAKKLGLPVFAIVDTNSNPEDADFPIPANDDASKSIAILTKTIIDAYIDGASKVKAKKAETHAIDGDEPKKTIKKSRTSVIKGLQKEKAELDKSASSMKRSSKEKNPKNSGENTLAETKTITKETPKDIETKVTTEKAANKIVSKITHKKETKKAEIKDVAKKTTDKKDAKKTETKDATKKTTDKKETKKAETKVTTEKAANKIVSKITDKKETKKAETKGATKKDANDVNKK